MNYSKGICWIDDCRIPFVDEKDLSNTINAKYTIDKNTDQSKDWFGIKKIGNVSKPEGRFPANLLVSDDMLNDGSVSKSNDNLRKNKTKDMMFNGTTGFKNIDTFGFNDKGTNSRYYDIDAWFKNLINNI